MRLRRVPELKFGYDESVDNGERIERLLRENPVPPADPPTKPERLARSAGALQLLWEPHQLLWEPLQPLWKPHQLLWRPLWL